MKPLIYLAVILLFLHTQAIAQTQGVEFTVPLKERRITAREVVNIVLKVNGKPGPVSLARIRVVSDKALQLVSKQIIQLNVKPGDSLFIPVKFFVPESTASGKDYTVSFFLENESGVLHKESCKLMMAVDRNVVMTPLVPSVVLTNVNDSISIPLKVSNKGNNSQKINVLARFPSALQGNGFHNSTQLSLRAFSDTTIYIRKRVTREMLSLDAFPVMISGIYLNGDLFSQVSVDVQTLKNVRYNHLPPTESDQYFRNYDNSISLGTQNLGSPFASYQMNGGGAIDLPSARLGYNIDAQLFKNFPSQPYLRNTFLTFETKHMGFTVGNISRNFDVNMNGRGISGYVVDSSRKNHYEVGYIDNASNLIQSSNFTIGTGRSAWGKYEFKGKKANFTSTALYNKDPFVRTENLLLGSDLLLILNKLRISATLSGGSSSEINNPSNRKPGLLAGFNIDGTVGQFTFNSNNLMSTSYYPGIRKGTMVFSERLTYSLSGFNIWTGVNYFSNKPRYVSEYLFSANNNWNAKAEAGISKIFNRLSVSLSPVYQSEYAKYNLAANNIISATTESYRLVTQLSYSAAKQSVFIGLESGMIENSMNHVASPQFKVNSNYRYGMFNLNANFQYGNFFVNEVLNGFILKTGNNRSISVTPTFQKSFMGSKLRVEAGLSYNKASISGTSMMLTGRTEYNLSAKTQLYAGLTRSEFTFSQYQYSYNNLQVGLTQKIPNARLGSKNSQLDVALYRDENQNGIRDDGDGNAKGQLLYVNGVAFITNHEGKITYKNLKDGNYTISVVSNGKWYTADHKILINKKNAKVEIPLSKTGTVKGNILYAFNEFSYEVIKQKSGVTIQAIDGNGIVTKTKTDEGGRFNLYLPTGSYTLAVDMSDLPEQVSCKDNDRLLVITPEKTENIKFELAVKTRKVETRKFMSTKDREKEREREKEK